jgi:hypothetical protein
MKLQNPLTGQEIPDSSIDSVAQLARKLWLAEKKVAELEAQFEEAKAEHLKLSQELVPDAMNELGMESLTLTNGYTIQISPFYSGSIPPNEGKTADPVRREKCFAWLRSKGFGSLIKTEVKVAAGQGDEKFVERVTKLLAKAKIPFVQGDNVHHMTLKSFIREQAEAGSPPPQDLFNTHIGKKATIKQKK